MTANVWCDRCNRQHVVRRPQAVRRGLEVTWRDVGEIVGGTIVFLTLFLGVPFVLWLVAS